MKKRKSLNFGGLIISKLKALTITFVLIVFIGGQGWGQTTIQSGSTFNASNIQTGYTVTINAGGTLNMDVDRSFTSVTTVNAGTSTITGSGILTISGENGVGIAPGNTLVINSTCNSTILRTTTSGNPCTISGTGTFNATGNIVINKAQGNNTGTMIIGPNVTVGCTQVQIGTGNNGSWNITVNGKLIIRGGIGFLEQADKTIGKTLNSGSTVEYDGYIDQTVYPTTYNNLILSGSGTKTISGVTTVNGTLSMEGTAIASASPAYGTNAKLQYNTATARTAGVEWVTPFIAAGGIVIAGTGAITLNEDKILYNALAVNDGATFNIPAAYSIKATSIANSGTVNVFSTSASVTGQLVAAGSSGEGTYNVQRWIPDELENSDDWHIISCPVTGGSSMQAWADQQQVNTGDGDYDLAPYAEQVGTNPWGDWDPFISQDGTDEFSRGKGYAMRRVVSPAYSYVTFTGTGIYTGTFGVAITRGANGWNALGNPYTSVISINSFLTTNAPTGASQLAESPNNVVYIYDPTTGNYTGTANGNIALGQGFIVKAKEDGGNITFNPAMQNTNAATFKNAEIPMATAHLKVTGGKLSAVATIKLGGGMTTGIDNWQDIGIFKGNPDIALYTRMPDDDTWDLQDQALPLPAGDDMVVPVGFDYAPGGEVTFTMSTRNFTGGPDIYLEDTHTGSLTLLSGDSLSYTATVAASSSGTGRFNLVVRKSATVGADLIMKENAFTVFTRNSEIMIKGEAGRNTRLELYTIDGRCLYSSKAQPGNLNSIDGSPFPAGIYLLKISRERSVQTTRLVLSK